MQGFKSFPERTKMTFEGGMTAIIGPNGSGKSNISDSIRWVLGEMSAKSLRGARMEDVIFNGTPKRPAANYAVVSLFLDTSEEYMAHRGVIADEPEESGLTPRQRVWDAEEAVITRKYYRTGESEYYINKKQVRLKDIYEFFYDTGIGREGYSVIGQGKIAEVLSVKGDERRSIFEEASGISKFRIKKTETERKLRDTDANLDRVRDIFAEVESRVEPLRKEAENAGKFIALSEEKKKLEVTIWLERIDMLRGDLESAEKALASSKLELDLAGDELDAIQREEDEFNNHGYALHRRRSALDERSVQLSEESAVLTQSNAVFETESRHYREKIESNARES
ncbi:MAG: AAA family ATPase, partial [Clostridia bacterium]|nr:AAA family ATPase [Clostridia bacterium]